MVLVATLGFPSFVVKTAKFSILSQKFPVIPWSSQINAIIVGATANLPNLVKALERCFNKTIYTL